MPIIKYLQYFQNLKHRLFLRLLKFGNIGTNVEISLGFNILNPKDISLGSDIYIGPYCNLYGHGGIKIDSGVIIGPHLTIYSANHNYKYDLEAIPYDNKLDKKMVIIQENVWIGGNVIILPGIVIGEGAIVAAGSVVTKNVPPFNLVGGNPAKKIGERNIDDYIKLKKEGKIYFKLKNETII